MYDFRTLSPLDFEELIRDLLQPELNLRLESFGPGRDQGIDFRYSTAVGDTIVQAKHYPDGASGSLLSAVAKENAKIAKLNPRTLRSSQDMGCPYTRKSRSLRACHKNCSD